MAGCKPKPWQERNVNMYKRCHGLFSLDCNPFCTCTDYRQHSGWKGCVRNISKHHKAPGFQDVADRVRAKSVPNQLEGETGHFYFQFLNHLAALHSCKKRSEGWDGNRQPIIRNSSSDSSPWCSSKTVDDTLRCWSRWQGLFSKTTSCSGHGTVVSVFSFPLVSMGGWFLTV